MPVRVKATDAESGIVKVNFYLAELKEGKLADGPLARHPRQERQGQAILGGRGASAREKGRFHDRRPGVQWRSDWSPWLTTRWKWPNLCARRQGNLKGKVTQGTIPQPSLDVTLTAKNPPLARQEHHASCEARHLYGHDRRQEVRICFEKVPPGEYIVSAVHKTFKDRRARKTILTSKPTKTVEADLDLTSK